MTSVSDMLVADDLTVLLGLIAATLFLVRNLYKPQPLAHPILLGRQSDVARVRNPGESAVYRNYGTGLMGRFPVRPAKEVNTLNDLVRSDLPSPRTLWSTKITNSQLNERVSAFGTGLQRLIGLHPNDSNVLLLLNDGIEFFITDLALSAHGIPSFTLTSLSLLSPVLESHPPSAIVTDAKFLSHVLELIYDSNETGHHKVIVVGEPNAEEVSHAQDHVEILRWADIESEGTKGDKIPVQPRKASDVFTVAFFEEAGFLHAAQFTHENISAGVTAIRGLLPTSNPLSALDTIASAHSMSTPFGRAVAYTALYEGASFATLDSTKMFGSSQEIKGVPDVLSVQSFPIPSPTVLVLKPAHLITMTNALIETAKNSTSLFPFAWRQKVSGIFEGFVSKDGLWDRLVFDGARAKVAGELAGTLRAVVVGGGSLAPSIITPARIAFSVPIINTYIHPASTAPVLASHPLDLQSFTTTDEVGGFAKVAHVGPPTVNIEAKVSGVEDDVVENGADPVGNLHIRGPSVGKILGVDLKADGHSIEDSEGWIFTGDKAKIQTNGSFKVL